MAKTYALQRSTSTVVTIDTVNNLITPLGPALSNVSTAAGREPAGSQNSQITFLGDTYILVSNTSGAIEVRKYDVIGNTWSLSSPSFNPTIVTLTVSSIVGVFSPGDTVTSGPASGTIATVSGSTIVVNVTAGIFPSAGVLTDSTSLATANITLASQGQQTPTCLQIVNNVLIAIWNESSTTNSKMAACTTVDGTNWTTRINTGANASLANSTGGSSVVWAGAVFFATSLGIGNFIPGTPSLPNGQFGTIDQGFDLGFPNPLTDTLTPQGGMAYWNGTLYFIKPSTSLSGPILFNLPQSWVFGASVPQWTAVPNVTGIVNAGSTIPGLEIGNSCLFVNNVGNLSILYSGGNTTKLAVATSASFPAFSDVSNDMLPASLATLPNQGITIYIDTRRRLNEQQWFFFRNVSVSGNNTTLCKWDGVHPIVVQTTFAGSDYILTSDRAGHLRTYTALQPGAFIADVFVSQSQADRTYIKATTLSGIFQVNDNFAVIGITTLTVNSITGTFNPGDTVTAGAATGTLTSVNGNIFVVTVTSGVFAGSGIVTDSNTSATATVTSSVPSTEGTVTTVSGNVLGFNVTNGTILAGVTITDLNSGATASTTSAPLQVTAFPGRAVLIYELRDTLSRNMDVFGEYSLVGDKWLPMTQGSGDSGSEALASSIPGTLQSFYWDAFSDLDGNTNNLWLRIVPRISVSALEAPLNPFVTIIQEDYLRPPITRAVSQQSLILVAPFGLDFTVGETVTGNTSGATGFVQYADHTHITLTAVTGAFIPGAPGELVTGSIAGHSARVGSVVTNVVTTNTLPADETTDIEEFHTASSIVARGHAQFVFQGRLSSNQTRIRFLKLTMRGSSVDSLAQISIFTSGQGSVNQYLSGNPFSTFQSLPLADQEIIISNTDIQNQPSALGKKYSVVVEFDLGSGQSGFVSTPFFRYE